MAKKPTEKQLYKLKNEWLGKFFEEVKPKEFYRAVFPEGSFEREGHFEDGKANGIITIVENDKAKNRIVFEEVPSGVQFMDLVIDAMRSGRVLAMEYQAYNWEHSKDVLLEPYFVKLFRHRWYLIGINREYKAFRSYSLDRIKRIALSEETFNFPRKFTPQDHFRDSFGIIRDENLLPQHTVLRTTISQAPYLRNLPLHSSQKEIAVTESYVDFELYISHTYDFIQELLSKGAAVEVLKPQSLRDKIKAEIQNMQTLYHL